MNDPKLNSKSIKDLYVNGRIDMLKAAVLLNKWNANGLDNNLRIVKTW